MAPHIRPNPSQRRGCHSEPKTLSAEDRARLLRPAVHVPCRVREWTASIHYELIAKNMHPDVAPGYIERSEAWFAAHPPKARPPPPPREEIDVEAVVAMIAKWGSRAPLAEYRKVGYSEEAIERVRARRAWFDEHDDELQAEIDRRWPGSSSSKPKKVIKAVKKKMT